MRERACAYAHMQEKGESAGRGSLCGAPDLVHEHASCFAVLAGQLCWHDLQLRRDMYFMYIVLVHMGPPRAHDRPLSSCWLAISSPDPANTERLLSSTRQTVATLADHIVKAPKHTAASHVAFSCGHLCMSACLWKLNNEASRLILLPCALGTTRRQMFFLIALERIAHGAVPLASGYGGTS